MVDYTPAGFHSITPYVSVPDAEKFIDFLKAAFDAEEIMRMPGPNGRIVHAEVRIGNSPLMLTEACDKMPAAPASFMLYVPNVDEVYQKALDAGAQSFEEPSDRFYGDRSGGVVGPQGNRWMIATHIEDVEPEEMERRAREYEQQLAAEEKEA